MNRHRLVTPPKEGGMGVRQMYWAYERQYVTMLLAMGLQPELFPYPLGAPVPRPQTPMLTYVALLQSM